MKKTHHSTEVILFAILPATGSFEPVKAPQCTYVLLPLEFLSHSLCSPIFNAMQEAQEPTCLLYTW